MCNQFSLYYKEMDKKALIRWNTHKGILKLKLTELAKDSVLFMDRCTLPSLLGEEKVPLY